MRLRLIAEKKDKDFFNYKDISSEMWAKKVKEAQEKHKVSFDLENDYFVAQREVDIPQNHWDWFKNVKFRCELYSACGDWEAPIHYFRCQLKDGYARDLHKDDFFIYIPCKAEGNSNLVQGKGDSWVAADNKDCDRNRPEKPSAFKAWQGLKKYLKKLVDDEIASLREE